MKPIGTGIVALLSILFSIDWANAQPTPSIQPGPNHDLQLPKELKWNSVDSRKLEKVALAKVNLKSPRPLQIVIARISLKQQPEIVVTPANGKRELETDGLKTSSFLKNHKCDLAINAAPFKPVHLFEGKPHDVRGLQIADGKIVSAGDEKVPCLVFDRNLKPEIYNVPPDRMDGILHAVSGFHVPLKDGKVSGDQKVLHPRTAIGYDAERKYLFLLVVDGRQKGKSEGVSVFEVGSILKQLGCLDGINLDGGGTTTLVTRENGKAVVQNTPIHGNVPGLQRPSASHLGFRFSKPKPDAPKPDADK